MSMTQLLVWDSVGSKYKGINSKFCVRALSGNIAADTALVASGATTDATADVGFWGGSTFAAGSIFDCSSPSTSLSSSSSGQ